MQFNYNNKAQARSRVGKLFRHKAMDFYLHFIVMACFWKPGFYAAFKSQASQTEMLVYTKKARNRKKAMKNKSERWVLEDYTMLWTQVVFWLFYDTAGIELCLFSNDFKNEKGITVAYRYLDDETTWIHAMVEIPKKDTWTMRSEFLQWADNMHAYTKKETRYYDPDSNYLPYFWTPKKTNHVETLKWAEKHARDNDYAHLIPFIRRLFTIYTDTRW